MTKANLKRATVTRSKRAAKPKGKLIVVAKAKLPPVTYARLPATVAPKPKTTPWREVRAEWMKDLAFRAEYDRIGPAMEMAFALAEARHAAGLTQAQVAKRMGTSQAAVARMESGRGNASLASIERYAHAVGKRPVVQLVAAE